MKRPILIIAIGYIIGILGGLYLQISIVLFLIFIAIIILLKINENKYHKIEDLFPDYKLFIDGKKKLWFLTIWKQPRFLLAYIKHVILKIN